MRPAPLNHNHSWVIFTNILNFFFQTPAKHVSFTCTCEESPPKPGCLLSCPSSQTLLLRSPRRRHRSSFRRGKHFWIPRLCLDGFASLNPKNFFDIDFSMIFFVLLIFASCLFSEKCRCYGASQSTLWSHQPAWAPGLRFC